MTTENRIQLAGFSALSTGLTVLKFFLNKAFTILLLGYGFHRYYKLTHWMDKHPEVPVRFVELFYAVLLMGCVFVLSPLLRLLMFPEAAEYAERGTLRDDLNKPTLTTAYSHYRFATAVCYAIVGVCIATISK